jgi:hypothetical protein
VKTKALLLLLLGLAFALVACATATPASPTASPQIVSPATAATGIPTAAAPAASPTAAPPTAVPTPTEFAPDVAEFPNLGNADQFGEQVPAGKYKPNRYFSIPFTFITDKMYRGMYEGFGVGQIFGIGTDRASYPEKMLLFWAVDPKYTPERIIAELRATQNATSTENQPAMLDGMSGTQFDMTYDLTLKIPALGKFVGHEGDSWSTNSRDGHLRFIALPIGGRTLLIYIEAPKDEWDTFLADANQVLGTVKFAQNGH